MNIFLFVAETSFGGNKKAPDAGPGAWKYYREMWWNKSDNQLQSIDFLYEKM